MAMALNTKEKVLPEKDLIDHLFKVAVGCRDQPEITLDSAFPTGRKERS